MRRYTDRYTSCMSEQGYTSYVTYSALLRAKVNWVGFRDRVSTVACVFFAFDLISKEENEGS